MHDRWRLSRREEVGEAVAVFLHLGARNKTTSKEEIDSYRVSAFESSGELLTQGGRNEVVSLE